MSKSIRDSIDKAFGIESIMINSALVSAQQRKRLYWVGKRNDDGSYSKVDIKQPIDKRLVVNDILDSGVSWTDKSYCLTASYNGVVAWNTIEKKQRTMVAKSVNFDISTPTKVGAMPRPNGELSKSQGLRLYSTDTKGVCLTGNGGGLGAKTGLYAIPQSENNIKKDIVYKVINKTINIKGKNYPINLKDGYYTIRKLSVSEAKRLQTIPEWFDMSVVSNSQAYKCLGNGWTVDVIAHILRSIKENNQKQGELR